ncbi:unnamed protein product [Linum tenue]|uniref:Uncharacterized protein n=1 Tax=Linum tenue TaxID=586396 RepID=A0AAV0MI43_9ROSI|nr:unnamed protein product [Linum tenue]
MQRLHSENFLLSQLRHGYSLLLLHLPMNVTNQKSVEL